MNLKTMLSERDRDEAWYDKYFPTHLPNINRHDELDYEIDQELRR